MALRGLPANIAGLKPDQSSGVSVDSSQVDRMIEAAWTATSGPSLETFLRTGGHEYFENEIVNRFAYAGDKQVGHWPDLSDATQNIRSQEGFGPDWPINVRTEQMFSVLTHDADFWFGDHEAVMDLPGRAGGEIANKLRTAQEGRADNPIPGFGPTPPRPVLAADETDLESLLVMLNTYFIAMMTGVV